ncbi:MAG: hypothetical protein A4E32_01178 [Methanomassiliicoccales archaeon PtaU1.Bin124]|nr:MAG: hypothetical protein A4E32_01178 [Methanomassiliicoccales archaeon PtaU1.Bin124]
MDEVSGAFKQWMERRDAEKDLDDQRRKEVKDAITALIGDAGDSSAELAEIKEMVKENQVQEERRPEPPKLGDDEDDNHTCPKCGRAMEEGDERCQYCGASLAKR